MMHRLRVLRSVRKVLLNNLQYKSSDELMHIVVAVELFKIIYKTMWIRCDE